MVGQIIFKEIRRLFKFNQFKDYEKEKSNGCLSAKIRVKCLKVPYGLQKESHIFRNRLNQGFQAVFLQDIAVGQ